MKELYSVPYKDKKKEYFLFLSFGARRSDDSLYARMCHFASILMPTGVEFKEEGRANKSDLITHTANPVYNEIRMILNVLSSLKLRLIFQIRYPNSLL